MRKIVQLNIFGEQEIAEESQKITKEAKFYDYDGFTEKFKSKKTTDDCYTPGDVYECIKGWVNEHVMPLDGIRVVRPFYPGGDYEKFDYQPGDLVLDNPPFSILSKIRKFYESRDISYFLFAPHLTLFSSFSKTERCCFIVVNSEIIYENGANVKTSFITNRMPGNLRVSVRGDLTRALKKIQAKKKEKAKLPEYVYPPYVISAATLGKIADRGIVLDFPRGEIEYIRTLDSQRPLKKNIFGNGFLISERLAAERLAAERLAEREKKTWQLSERELNIIKTLQQNGNENNQEHKSPVPPDGGTQDAGKVL